MNKQQIASALKLARKKAGMTCKEVALKLEKSEKTVSAWEHCNGQPDIETLFCLCNIYGCNSFDELLGYPFSEQPFAPKAEEADLLALYRCLTTNSKQIVLTVAGLELNHVSAFKQGETPIRILPKSKAETETAVTNALKEKAAPERERLLKVFNQSAAAGYGNFIDDDSFASVAVPSIPDGTEFGIRISGDSMQPEINDGDIVFVQRKSSIEPGEIGVFIYDGEAYCKQLVYRDNTYFLRSFNPKYKDIPILSDSIYSVGLVLDKFQLENDELS